MADENLEQEETQEPSAEATEAQSPEASAAEPAAEPTPPPEPVVEPEPVAAEVEAAPTEEPSAPELTLGAASAPVEGEGDDVDVPQTAALIRGKVDESGVAMGTGRRKTAVARVRVRDGAGSLTVNGRSLDEYFPVERDRLMVEAPLKATATLGKVDVWVRVNGGGTTGQTGAVVLGIARALQAKDPSLHHSLSEGGYLTRDGRMVERKKYGYKKARRSFQFSKR